VDIKSWLAEMRLRYETKECISGIDTEFPDYSFNHAYNGVGIPTGQRVQVSYMVAPDMENAIKALAAEIIAHLLGRYR
jgi:hypothetical protein